MDTRPRILIVEDHDALRESFVELLTDEGFKTHGVASLAEAKEAADRCSYHVALIDIMLKGDDTSNRDGVDVVRYLRWLQEDTHPLVLSAQTQSRTLVRDLLRKYGAIDYLDKEELEQKESGNAFLIEKIRSLLESPNAPPKIGDWSKLSKSLAGASSEQAFVSLCLRNLNFKGGFENLNNCLQHAGKHLVPLLPKATGSQLRPAKVQEVLNGTFWSKGQGTAVEILLFGTNVSPEVLEAEWRLAERTTLYNRAKGGLTIIVLECPELTRDQFATLV